MQQTGGDNNIKICLRVRPMTVAEIAAGDQDAVVCIGECGTSLQLLSTTTGDSTNRKKNTVHSFDAVLAANAGQRHIYSLLGEPVVRGVVDGFHGCIFAYGHTGSGKSHSVFGKPGEDRGLVPRVAEGLFAELNATGEEHIVRFSYLEIHNERVRDLLQPTPQRSGASLEIREHPKYGVFVEKLTKSAVRNISDVSNLLDFGHKIRVVGCTNMNAASSRSHAIVTLHVERVVAPEGAGTDGSGGGRSSTTRVRRRAHIHCVDLAGSERLKGEHCDIRQKESKEINKSLSALSLMISRLVAREQTHTVGAAGNGPHVPYRNSKLTFLLAGSLMGNCKTAMLACIAPSSSCLGMTESTIQFAESVKRIQTRPVKNDEFEGDLVKALRSEIDSLKQQLRDVSSDSSNRDIQERIRATQVLQDELSRSWEEEEVHSRNAESQRRLTLAQMGLCIAGTGDEELLSTTCLVTGALELASTTRFLSLPPPECKAGASCTGPYLVNICDDPLLSGCLVYGLPLGETIRIGSDPNCAVCVDGLGIYPEMCSFLCVDKRTVEVRAAMRGRESVVSSAAISEDGISTTSTGIEEDLSHRRLAKKKSSCPRRGSLFKRGFAEIFVNGFRVLTSRRLQHGDRIRVGLTHRFKLCIPDVRKESHELSMRIIEDITVDCSDQKFLAQEYIGHLENRIGPKRATKVMHDLRAMQPLVDEANELTDELRGGEDKELVFKLHVLTDVTDTDDDPEMAVVLWLMERPDEITQNGPRWHNADAKAGVSTAVWSLPQFQRRLDVLRDLYREISNRDTQWGEPSDPDPWKDDNRVPLVGSASGALRRQALQHDGERSSEVEAPDGDRHYRDLAVLLGERLRQAQAELAEARTELGEARARRQAKEDGAAAFEEAQQLAERQPPNPAARSSAPAGGKLRAKPDAAEKPPAPGGVVRVRPGEMDGAD